MKIDSETKCLDLALEHSLKRKNRKGRALKHEQKRNVKEEDKNIKQENKRHSKQDGENVMNQSKALKTDQKQIQRGRKQYLCQYCEREFKQSSHLKAHEMIHTGEKPNSCQYCSQQFRQGLLYGWTEHSADFFEKMSDG